ncbi:Rpn family recombination-promoting nuclease/putative transposase [Klebsiella grimontii]|uniref:Rpn family recombination-promoting nuclease/putative transposase n=1 Tax=Klebsiella TaxID=570 RepID=UPI0006687CDB|nr:MULTISPECIES: Rpn family recombination-promoting nuclease/putative transposase [Klebsiella]RFP45871.1 Rpn family recombination-promoting nuclease/putative transposase [Klebsiella oxytoca]MBD0903255.1 Rpn family recombination-promoting nuclease/putative transposase [Klebsiella grimontii]MBZ6971477.1 Rpn family recombination-promoting nuclease/putative transposase [Klebsiella grimontii]MBZ7826234.1 Rpn family recombination-promoting nuclease/putative transposase [Klebsiella grimontii]MDK70264
MERFSRTPHDAIFRQMLTQKEVARDFLQLYLPAPFLSICDLNTLQLASGSFIEEDLRSSDSDILYSLQTRHGAGYIYALIEHQSSPDKLMAFRLMRYMLQAGSTEKPGPLIRELAKQSPRHKELMMTIAEWLEGRKGNSRSIALKMLASGLDPKMVMELTGLSQEELSSLSP